MRHHALSFILLAGAFRQTSQVPYAPDRDGPGPTFTSENISLSYPGSYSLIRKVDFRNLNGKPAGSFSLKNGHYKDDEPGSHFSMDVDSIYYLSTGFALVLYSWFDAEGSSSQGRIAELFTVTGSHLRSVQTIDWNTHFQAGQPTHSFDSNTNTLLIRSAHYIPGDAHCCISAMDVVTFGWNGAHLVQSGIQTELSEYGKSQGTILPKALPRLP
jgi:hypothetical protein